MASSRWAVKAFGVLVLGGALAGPLAGCNGHNAADVYSPQEWRDLFAKSEGWVALRVPDSKYIPGAIVKVTEREGIRYISHMSTCRYPDELLKPVVGIIPGAEFRKARRFNASAVIKESRLGIEAGPEFKSDYKIDLKVDSHTAESLDLLALRIWQDEPAHSALVPRSCSALLAEADHYVIGEAARVQKATYTLVDETGAAITLNTGNLLKFLKLEPSLSYNVTTDGKLVIDQPVTIALRRVTWLGDRFAILGKDGGASAPPLADEILKRISATDP